jgi:hypothetical protein
MNQTITVAAIQCALPGPLAANIATVEAHVREDHPAARIV